VAPWEFAGSAADLSAEADVIAAMEVSFSMSLRFMEGMLAF